MFLKSQPEKNFYLCLYTDSFDFFMTNIKSLLVCNGKHMSIFCSKVHRIQYTQVVFGNQIFLNTDCKYFFKNLFQTAKSYIGLRRHQLLQNLSRKQKITTSLLQRRQKNIQNLTNLWNLLLRVNHQLCQVVRIFYSLFYKLQSILLKFNFLIILILNI